MSKDFFIMIYSQDGSTAFPITDADDMDLPAFWSTEEEAREFAKGHILASAFGFEIFEMGTGL